MIVPKNSPTDDTATPIVLPTFTRRKSQTTISKSASTEKTQSPLTLTKFVQSTRYPGVLFALAQVQK